MSRIESNCGGATVGCVCVVGSRWHLLTPLTHTHTHEHRHTHRERERERERERDHTQCLEYRNGPPSHIPELEGKGKNISSLVSLGFCPGEKKLSMQIAICSIFALHGNLGMYNYVDFICLQ